MLGFLLWQKINELSERAMLLKERFAGALWGLACGDALGTTLEFKPPHTFEPLTDMVGGGPFNLPRGYWTDDTSMALCLAESIIACQAFNPTDQMERYVRWYRQGHLSSIGRCFDIGNATRAALHRFEQTGEPYSGSSNPYSAGNGSIMRLAPVPMAWYNHPQMAMSHAVDSSRTTHGALTCLDACRYMTGLIVGAINGESKAALLSSLYCPLPDYWQSHPLTSEIETVAKGSFKQLNPPQIQGSGYVVKSLEAALWAFYHTTTFEEGCLLAVNLGDDADTTGAVYGQIAGAFYGMSAIPAHWREVIALSPTFADMVEGLWAIAQ